MNDGMGNPVVQEVGAYCQSMSPYECSQGIEVDYAKLFLFLFLFARTLLGCDSVLPAKFHGQ